MISLTKQINAFSTLGKLFSKVADGSVRSNENPHLSSLNDAVVNSGNSNRWFVENNVRYMLKSLGSSLSQENIEKWIGKYYDKITDSAAGKTVGVVMAGNIPLVGFHDFLSVIMSGNKILAKLSSDDDILLPVIAEILIEIEPELDPLICFADGKLEKIDAIIATGSNNTSRYFEYYFGKYPNIIRKNRNSVAVLTGNETEEELIGISNDIFMYYGLGCRNVSHLMVPKNYDFKDLLDICSENKQINENNSYFNNYEYNKAIFLVNGTEHLDSGNLLITEDNRLSSPVSVIHISYYSDISSVKEQLASQKSEIQCVVTSLNEIENSVLPGNSQSPDLWDYADGVDTMEFLLNL